jgi:protein-L-isoaspartate O-methyltransferase
MVDQLPWIPKTGVAFNAPPQNLLGQATALLDAQMKALPPGTNGAVVGIATESGWNAAVVSKVGDHAVVHAWVGKEWGKELTGGAAVRATW